MTNNIILRTSNELGNQMFMYAAGYSISKQLNRSLYIDDETAFLSKKNISSYGLNHFKISASLAPDSLKFKNLKGYIKRKFLIKTDFFRYKKKFFIEKKDLNNSEIFCPNSLIIPAPIMKYPDMNIAKINDHDTPSLWIK